jgi:DNA invertase Pin-like site-specific DNA recombinase
VQKQPLRELVAQRGWELYRVYSDRDSGSKEKRPGLDALVNDARRGAFSVVVVWRFDRFAGDWHLSITPGVFPWATSTTMARYHRSADDVPQAK